MLQFPKHGNKEILERNGRLRITSGPVFTRHLNATTTMAVRSVTSSPGASLERRFKGRGTWDVGRDRGKGSNCEEQPLLTHPVSHTHTTQGGARCEERDRGKGSNYEEQSLLTHPVSHTTQGGARNEGRDRGKAASGEGRDRGKGARREKKSLLTHPVSHTHTTQGGARDETEGKVRTARNNHCSLTLFLTLTLRKELRGTRREERGTNSYLLFTIYCSLFTPAYAKASAGRIHYSLFAIHCSLQRNIPMLLPRQLHRLGFEHPEGADQF